MEIFSYFIQFPEMVGNINGEESATFTNTLGESVTIAIGENAQETAACLEKVHDTHSYI